jgi:hypothetical protein
MDRAVYGDEPLLVFLKLFIASRVSTLNFILEKRLVIIKIQEATKS